MDPVKLEARDSKHSWLLLIVLAFAGAVYLGSRDVYKSADMGMSWTNLTSDFQIY